MTDDLHVFVNEGDYWTIRYGSAAFRLKDSKGLHYLATLLAHPGQEFHAIDLVTVPGAAGGRPPGRRNGGSGAAREDGLSVGRLGDAGELLDAKAKAAYRRRLLELSAEAEEAEEFNDSERAARARAEIEALEDQLSAAFGLGGRPRRAGSAAERARVNVKNSITSAVKAISTHGPELGEHLNRTIRTGTFCWYAAEGGKWTTDPKDLVAESNGSSGSAGTAPERVLGTFLFIDIVESTKRASGLGDRRWRQLLDQHDAAVKEELAAHAGRQVNTFGDSVFAVFDLPAGAIRCAVAIRDRTDALGLAVRTGVHTGECERRGEDFGGIGLHIAARIMAEADAAEILVSSTVREIVAGSDIVFADSGFHALRGVPGTWRLFAVTESSAGTARPSARRPRSKTMSLMVVDDHPMWRQTLRTVLEGSGVAIVVAEAADGDEAVEMARSARPDVVVMDMHLLTVNGVEATRRLLEILPETKVLMLSSSDEREDVVEAVKAGASGYLLKTAEPGEVADAVRRICSGELVFPAALAKVVLEEFRRMGSRAPARPTRAKRS